MSVMTTVISYFLHKVDSASGSVDLATTRITAYTELPNIQIIFRFANILNVTTFQLRKKKTE